MRTSSAKAKGRRLQDWVRDLLHTNTGFDGDDIRSAIMGETGADVKLTKRATKKFPYSIECKNQEVFKGIYKMYSQATSHEDKLEPLLIIKMNGKKPLVILDAEYFIKENTYG